MLILAGVSLNATIGENGIITRAQETNFVQSMAILEEYLNQYYVEHYEEMKEAESKVQALKLLEPNYFFSGAPLGYIVDSDLNIHYFINKEGLPDDIKSQIVGGDAGNKTYADYASMKDVYGVTKDLKVYYCRDGKDTWMGAENSYFEDPMKEIFPAGSVLAKKIKGNETESVTANDLKSVKELTITQEDGITTFESFYQFTSLEKLIFQGVTLGNLNGIENATKLNYIEFSNAIISEENGCSAVGKCTGLATLKVYMPTNDIVKKLCNGMKDGDLTKLETFGLYGYFGYNMEKLDTVNNNSGVKSQLTNISPLGGLSEATKKAVKTIYFNNNKIEDISALSEFTNLENIRLECNEIKTISPAFNKINPKYLLLNHNKLGINETTLKNETTDAIASLINSNNLFYLNLSYNGDLKHISYLKETKSLRQLLLNEDNNLESGEISEIKDILSACSLLQMPSKYFLALDNSTKLNLSNLDLTDNDISFLKNNTNLEALNLSGNTKLTDSKLQEVLSTLTNLKALGLTGTNLDSINFTRNIHNLVSLYISNTQVKDVSLLEENEKKLNSLEINNSEIDLTTIQSTISRLGTGQNVYTDIVDGTRGLGINNAKLIKKLKDCTNITRLEMYNTTGAANTTVDLSTCTKLTYLLSRGNSCKIILPSSITILHTEDTSYDFSRCINLKDVTFQWKAGIQSVFDQLCEELKDKTGLNSITISGIQKLNNINSISKLKNSGLKKICIYGTSNAINPLSDLTPLQEITSLENITLIWSKVTNLPDFSKLINLKTLDITYSLLKELEGIKNCTNLTTINLSNNSISSIHGIENLRKLTNFNIANNSLYDTYSYTDENTGVVTKNTVDILADLNKNGALNTLNISGNTGITGYGELPNLKWTGFAK